MSKLDAWLRAGDHLPPCMRDFHDQKSLFKAMHELYEPNQEEVEDHRKMPNWVIGHIYVIDWFLWFMAKRGYTLQRSRKKDIDFLDFEETIDAANRRRTKASYSIFKGSLK